MKITKEEAVATVIREGKFYKSKLAGSVLLIIYRDRDDNLLKTLEIEFFPHHYQHLTGIKRGIIRMCGDVGASAYISFLSLLDYKSSDADIRGKGFHVSGACTLAADICA